MAGLLMGLVYYYDFTRAQRDVMLNLCDHAHEDGTNCRPSLETLNWKTKSDRRNVQKIIRSLEQMGVLVPVAYLTGGRGKATEYEIHLEAAPLKAIPPPSEGMRRIWEMLKGGNTTAVLCEDDEKGGNSTAVSSEKGGASTAVSSKSRKGRYSTHEKGGNSRIKGGNSRIKGGTITAPTVIEPSYEPSEEPAHTRDPLSQAKKIEAPDPDPEADPPQLRGAPPTFGEFASEYRKQPGKGMLTKYSEIRAAYWDAFGMTPEQAAELRAEMYA